MGSRKLLGKSSMAKKNLILCVLSIGVMFCLGCAQGGLGARRTAMTQATTDNAQLAAQMQDLNQRIQRFDADNNALQTEVARLQQQLGVADEEKALLREQLAATTQQLQQVQVANQEADQRLNALQASTKFNGGATISANNSLIRGLQTVEIAGLQVRQDGDVIRVELPTDKVFSAGTTQLSSLGITYLDQVAAAVRQHYPRQIVGIEGHFDSQSLTNSTYTTHQLTATQAIAVLHQLTRSGLPERQLFTMSMGASRPLYSNGDAEGQAGNRRVEVVIYPETYESL